MNQKTPLKRPVLYYFLLSVIIFLVFLGTIVALMALNADTWLTTALEILAAWSSTFAFIILFKRIYPNQSLKTFIKNLFKNKVNPYVLAAAILLQVIIIIVTIYLLGSFSIGQYKGIVSLNIGTFILLFLNHLSRGPLGEELGWRGYLQNELEKKHSTLKSSLVVGLLWATWHMPLWLASGYIGMDLLLYSIAFMTGVVSLSVVMGFFYKLNKNILVPIVMHFLFNFLLALIIAELLWMLVFVCSCYLVVAVVLIVINPKKVLRA